MKMGAAALPWSGAVPAPKLNTGVEAPFDAALEPPPKLNMPPDPLPAGWLGGPPKLNDTEAPPSLPLTNGLLNDLSPLPPNANDPGADTVPDPKRIEPFGSLG